MKGIVDTKGRALLSVEIQSTSTSRVEAVDVWIDTGFTGDLVLPRAVIDALSLKQSGTVDAILADGSEIEVKTYTCIVNWFGENRRLEVVENNGDHPLLGAGMLLNLELRINYHTAKLELDAP
jgi:clan AA aspartic protease